MERKLFYPKSTLHSPCVDTLAFTLKVQKTYLTPFLSLIGRDWKGFGRDLSYSILPRYLCR